MRKRLATLAAVTALAALTPACGSDYDEERPAGGTTDSQTETEQKPSDDGGGPGGY